MQVVRVTFAPPVCHVNVLSQKSLLCLPAPSQDSRGDAYLVESVSDSLVNGGYFLGV